MYKKIHTLKKRAYTFTFLICELIVNLLKQFNYSYCITTLSNCLVKFVGNTRKFLIFRTNEGTLLKITIQIKCHIVSIPLFLMFKPVTLFFENFKQLSKLKSA